MCFNVAMNIKCVFRVLYTHQAIYPLFVRDVGAGVATHTLEKNGD
jgi:hypothetical protein